ncbi:MAG TPA: anti-anti-sigma factor [Cyanobacteria bacterium UBA11149]|nr:anti-anti-sigma factor [Cyanobacteria bacterium UBA11367]HBE59281.1 anti-anti-sigma factor [Cyanobacteria bacterium UBA11366]HBK64745.1 anti-anti-sigma factor [Cyanobacteria bacterium UBA11166]HBR76721.1 anti-anti-sigma factor [Cyanobacteria bacterium UBA11159]HBS68364.1 anti-anti-sigma factor [Cyanobacteria bacterium UBA11153]HBW91504.1 anti-anti-sigma factor [Cyanobacteria bacterium UBA11149]HCA94625.1 anti-anti-sigma factor [Cyanobacteria bacterium UBA9226]
MVNLMSKVDFPVMPLQDISVVQIPVRLSVLEAVEFKETCQKFLENNSLPQKIVCDFSKTTFIDSCGIGALVNSYRSAREAGVDFVLRSVNDPVMAVLTMTGLDRIFKLEEMPPSRSPLAIPQLEGKSATEVYPTPGKAAEKSALSSLFRRTQVPVTHPSVRSWVKRSLDAIGGIIGLGLTAIAFMPIAILIKWDSPGPIFFRQTRKGLMGKEFTIWKFRSMYVGTGTLCNGKIRIKEIGDNSLVDPRVTRVGRFLRRTSLDELPQFWNVLMGDMSLVGTRPPTPDEVEYYDVPEWQRLDVKPGMTGEWQVNGRNQIKEFKDIIELDLRYQKNWSLIHDLKLILKTILIVFTKDSGAG